MHIRIIGLGYGLEPWMWTLPPNCFGPSSVFNCKVDYM